VNKNDARCCGPHHSIWSIEGPDDMMITKNVGISSVAAGGVIYHDFLWHLAIYSLLWYSFLWLTESIRTKYEKGNWQRGEWTCSMRKKTITHSLVISPLTGTIVATKVVQRNKMVTSVHQALSTALVCHVTTQFLTQYVCTNAFYRKKITWSLTKQEKQRKHRDLLPPIGCEEQGDWKDIKRCSRTCCWCHMHIRGSRTKMELWALHTWEC
jgi:hypothetical protein